MTDVFISYSRKDKDFVQVLHRALVEGQFETWVDWEDIPLTADWWQEIQSGIDAADTFVFVISPDSISSKVCGDEIDHAVANHKRLLPIVRRDGFDMAQVRPALGRHNWLFFRENDDFEPAFQSLVTALKTDLDHVKTHTRLLVRAREWEAKQRPADVLLRGSDLEAAEDWLLQGSRKQPYPTDLQQDYISSSRKAEAQQQQQERRRLRTFLAAVSGLAVVALALAGFALAQRSEAVARRQEAIEQRERAYEQAKVAFAHQLAAEAKDPTQRALAGLQTLQQQGDETQVAFGLATLPADKVRLLQNVDARLIVLSKSKQFLAALAQDRTLWVWDLQGKQVVLQAQPNLDIVDLDFSPDDQLLTAATRNGELRIWRVNSVRYDLIAVLPGHNGPLTDTAFSEDGRYLVTAGSDGLAKIWDFSQIGANASNTLQPIALLRHPNAINSVVVSPDQQVIITAGQDKTLRLWAMDGQQRLCIAHSEPVRMVGFSDNTRYLGSVSGNSQIRLWPWPELNQNPDQLEGVQPEC